MVTLRKDSVHDDEDTHIHDVLIIGAGPCGLAVAARLREPHPSALFTDVEQARYHWMARNAHRTSVRDRRSGRSTAKSQTKNAAGGAGDVDMIVLDSTSGEQWMSRWRSLFEKLKIESLRSPMFFHPDPSDRDALLAFVHETGGLGDAKEIAGCVGKELSKHQKKKRTKRRGDGPTPAVTTVDERDRKDYFAPSSASFNAFCGGIIDRYDLSKGVLRQGTVSDVTYAPHPSHPDFENVFIVQTTEGRKYLAHTVVLAVGAGQPNVPAPFPSKIPMERATHALHLGTRYLLPQDLRRRIKEGDGRGTNLLVIGGGLTSAQVVDYAVRTGVGHVHLLMRGPMKVKPFDIDLAWMSKFQNHERAAFWSADSFEERMAMLTTARNGGSITPRYAKRLHDLVASNRLSIHTHTTVTSQSYDQGTGLWTITTSTSSPSPQTPSSTSLPSFNHVIFATGTTGGITSLPFLSSLAQKHPIEQLAGLPVLTDDLQLRPDIPLFVTGKLASLELGPGAGNLEGARVGAERCGWGVEGWLSKIRQGKGGGECAEESGEGRMREEYVLGRGSKFSGLEEE